MKVRLAPRRLAIAGVLSLALPGIALGSNATVRSFAVRVSGKFVTARGARGRVRVKVTVFRVRDGQPRRQIGKPCEASGTWKAKHE